MCVYIERQRARNAYKTSVVFMDDSVVLGVIRTIKIIEIRNIPRLDRERLRLKIYRETLKLEAEMVPQYFIS